MGAAGEVEVQLQRAVSDTIEELELPFGWADVGFASPERYQHDAACAEPAA